MTEIELKNKQKNVHRLVNTLLKNLSDNGAVAKRLRNDLELFDDNINYLLDKEHRLAFIGKIGVGKTTAICYLLQYYSR